MYTFKKSVVCIFPLVCSLKFTSVRILPTVCSLQSVFDFTLTAIQISRAKSSQSRHSSSI